MRDGGYVYMYGTPNGRTGAAYLARVAEANVLTQGLSYEYWTGFRPGPSTGVLGRRRSSPSPVAELSVQKNAYSGKWLMTYMQGTDIVLRNATGPTASWSSPQVIASDADYPGPYGGFMHPWSSGADLYFAMSQWDPYNVYLMQRQHSRTPGGPDQPQPGAPTRASSGRPPSSVASPWACTGNCGIDNGIWGVTGDRNGFVRYNSGWHDLHQVVAVTQNTNYRMTGWIRTSGNNDNGFFGVRNVGGAPISEVNFTSVGSWTRYSVTFNSGSRTQVETLHRHLDRQRRHVGADRRLLADQILTQPLHQQTHEEREPMKHRSLALAVTAIVIGATRAQRVRYRHTRVG